MKICTDKENMKYNIITVQISYCTRVEQQGINPLLFQCLYLLEFVFFYQDTSFHSQACHLTLSAHPLSAPWACY